MTHDDPTPGSFDERRVGLDHFAFQVADRNELERVRGLARIFDPPASRIAQVDLRWWLASRLVVFLLGVLMVLAVVGKLD